MGPALNIALRDALQLAHAHDLPLELPVLCPCCLTMQPWVTFESTPLAWPHDICCGLCVARVEDDYEADRVYGAHPAGDF